MAFVTRFFRKIDNSTFIFGPRGTGKSSWLKTAYINTTVIDLLKDGDFRIYSSNPDRLEQCIDPKLEKQTIIIDEVQKIPALLSVVHLLMEANPHIQFILTGSSARKLKRAGTDLLAGRAWLKKMHPFMASELGNQFSLDQALLLGLLPVVFDSSNPKEVLKAYIGLYLKEEVLIEGLVRDVGSFSRFLEALSFSHGSVLNISNIARECSVNRKTAEGYIDIAYDLLIAHKLDVFEKKSKRRLTSHPKFYYFDTGVFRSLRPSGPLDEPEMISGQALEGLVFQHLLAWVEYQNNDFELKYWRTKDGTEVDFIVYGEHGFWALEVKHSGQIRSKDLNPLKSFYKDYPQCTPIFLYRGKEKKVVSNIHCLSVESFLKQLNPDKLLY